MRSIQTIFLIFIFLQSVILSTRALIWAPPSWVNSSCSVDLYERLDGQVIGPQPPEGLILYNLLLLHDSMSSEFNLFLLTKYPVNIELFCPTKFTPKGIFLIFFLLLRFLVS